MKPNESVPLSKLIATFFYMLIFPAILLALGGDWRWTEAWVYSIVFYVMCAATLLYLHFKDPALLKERYGSPVQKEQKSWDKVLLLLFFLEFLVWFMLMPLDARRFHWSPEFPLWSRIAGALLLVLAMVMLFEAMRENTFAAPVVKMQKERGQKVISTGMYGVIRHPMYAGAVLLFISAPMLLGSFYGLAIGFLLIVTLAARSLGEEAMLRQELDGYSDYMKKVKWRIIPFVF